MAKLEDEEDFVKKAEYEKSRTCFIETHLFM